MTTATSAISQDQLQKWSVAVQEFVTDIYKQYPGLDGAFTTHLIDEVKALGLAREYISSRSLWAAFRNCAADGRIVLPPTEPVLTDEVINKIKASFPPVIKRVEREQTQREKSALAGISKQTGRVSHASEMQERNSAIDKSYTDERNKKRLNLLRIEYKGLKVAAETAMGNNAKNHAETYAIRKSLLAKLNTDPKFKEVHDQS